MKSHNFLAHVTHRAGPVTEGSDVTLALTSCGASLHSLAWPSLLLVTSSKVTGDLGMEVVWGMEC